MSIKDDMNSSGEYLPTKWTRTTVADGDWLHANTIKPLSSRDDYLADKIDELSGNTDDRLDEEIAARIAGDEQLYDELSTVSSDFYSFSADVETSAYALSAAITAEADVRKRVDEDLLGKIEQLQNATDVVDVVGTHAALVAYDEPLTKNDVVKVLVDETKNNLEYYWRVVGDEPKKPYQWTEVGTITPYYSKSEIDNKENTLSSTIANNYLSASTAAVSAGKNILVTKETGPVIGIKTPDDVSFSNLTSTNITATAIDTTTINAETVNATTTISTNFSGSTLSGETLYTSIDGLIESATNGGSMTGVKNVSGIKLTHIANQRDYENNPDDGEFGFSTSADQLTFYVSGGAAEWLKPQVGGNPYGICLTGESIENYLGGKSLNITADYAYTAATTLDTFTAKTPNNEYVGEINQLYLSAGKGIDFVSGNDGKLTISSEGTTYTTGQYINISNDNKISVTGTLINSAQSGQSAYNWITAQSATLSAGPGIKFTSAGQNTMGICVSAGGVGGVITAIAGSALSAGSTYVGGDYISINPNNNSINLSSNISADNISANLIQAKTEYFSAGLDYRGLSITGFNRTYTASIDLSYFNASYKCAGSAGTAPWSAIINNANSNWVSSNPAGITISSDSVVKLVFTPTLPSTLDDNTYYIV